MSKRANPMAVGGFVLGAVALVVTAILVFSSGTWFKQPLRLVTHFPGTVQGLRVGAPVQFQGVQIGQVTAIKLYYRAQETKFDIPVYFEIWADSLVVHPEAKGDDPVEVIRHLVENAGLRTRLETISFVTGQYMVTLGLFPDTPANYVGLDPTVPEIPSVESYRDRVASMLENLALDELVQTAIAALNAVKNLAEAEELTNLLTNAGASMAETKKLLQKVNTGVEALFQQFNATLLDYSGLADNASQRVTTVADSAEATLGEIRNLSANIDKEVRPLAASATAAFDEARGLVDQDSASRANLDTLLEEAAAAARSLRILADYLEQNPDALIRGKYR